MRGGVDGLGMGMVLGTSYGNDGRGFGMRKEGREEERGEVGRRRGGVY